MNWEQAADSLITVRDLLRLAVSAFSAHQIYFGHGYPGPTEEASYLVLHALGLPHDQRELWLDARLLPEERRTVLALVRRRVEERIPAAYLTHEAWLGPFRFYVDERTIVPRSFIADALQDGLEPWIEDFDAVTRAADICTGGGSLAILLALRCPYAQVDAVDLSSDALEVARKNVADYGLEDRIRLHRGDLLEGLEQNAYDLVISNPPYVDQAAMASLPAEYRKEPEMALASGLDGLDHVRRLLEQAPAYLKRGGLLVVEIGHQRAALEAAFPEIPWVWLDLPGGDSYVFAVCREDLPGA
ncbi:MAG: 50S ribosomal protein L3 N(5)-glutamine methyltransferase [Betaproteobacteria bacterium]|nr:50S ribosomal protein L3 N(5)-glutamine methyltransferase [Betaproteobacteria bacterium]MDE2621978.1 50S ribosomal protein L3 N(5)-glutamine methyltransferase [Betaproteobacteria bacterium]